MAIFKCPECGREISDQALACPNCGFNVQNYVRIRQNEQRAAEYREREAQRKVQVRANFEKNLKISLVARILSYVTAVFLLFLTVYGLSDGWVSGINWFTLVLALAASVMISFRVRGLVLASAILLSVIALFSILDFVGLFNGRLLSRADPVSLVFGVLTMVAAILACIFAFVYFGRTKVKPS